MLTMGSLFDGIGGFPLAAVRNGITPVWASEIEAFPIEVTNHHFPGMIHVGDITKLDGAKLPPADIICGGSPCQDLSVAGARAGLSGARSGLFMEQIRIVKEMRNADRQRGRTGIAVRPRWMCWENVPGAFSSGTPKGEDFRVVLEEIVRIKSDPVYVPGPYPWAWQSAGRIVLGNDFSLAWRVFDAQYWPAPLSEEDVYSLSQILQADPPRKYYLSRTACLGILRRAKERGKELPPQLKAALMAQSGLSPMTEPASETIAFAGNQRDEVRNLHNVAGALSAQPGMKQQTFIVQDCLTPWDTQQARVFTPESKAPALTGADGGGGRNPAGLLFTAGFCAGAAPTAGGIGYQTECAPTLKAAESGTNMVPSILCLNDQGGSVMECSEDVSGTLRAQEHGHQPLVLYDNHGKDARYKGPLRVAPTVVTTYGTGGNNVPLVSPFTFSRQRADVFTDNNVASTESARQHKDATDLVYQETVGALTSSDRKGPNSQYVGQDKLVIDGPLLIRRLTPLECERLQDFPDFWTDLPGASDSSRYKALGNSVAIPCVEHIMRGIAMAACQRG